MGYNEGMAALNLEMPNMIPRVEYSADTHWELVKSVTGIDVDEHSKKEIQYKASSNFVDKWDYGFYWNIYTDRKIFGDKCTKMGHAEFAAGGTDFSSEKSEYFEEPEDVFAFDFDKEFGMRNETDLINQFNEDFDNQHAKYPSCVPMTGIYVTCISGLVELLGWDMLLVAAGTDTKAFGDFTNRYAKWIQQYFNALAKCKAPVVMVHDDIVWTDGPFIHPDFYRNFVFPNFHKLLAPLHETGKKIIFTSDGNYTQFIDDVAKCGVDCFVLEPLTDMQYIAEKYGKTHSFVGNADTRILLSGTKENIKKEVERCINIGKKYPGFFMAVGNHIPANTPVENALYYNEVFNTLRRR